MNWRNTLSDTVPIKNFNIQEVHTYAKKMKELVDYMFANIYSCRNFGSFHFNKSGGSIQYKNNIPFVHENLIFSVQRVSQGTWRGQQSNVIHRPFPYKLEFFENGTPMCQEVSTIKGKEDLHLGLDYHNYYSKEQLEDEGFLFQQSLVMEEEALFGVCCASWLYNMKMQFTYIICEFDVDEMNRVHKVVFDDVRT